MKKKILLILMGSVLLSSGFASEQDVNNSFDSMIETFRNYTPENTSMLLTQPEAYIGKFFPSFPPHFTAGLSVSGTFLDTSFLKDAVSSISDEISSALSDSENSVSISSNFDAFGKLPVPTMAVNARIGGILLPFDIGVSAISTFKTLNDKDISDYYKLNLEYTSIGADLRYEILQEGKIFPSTSVGVGYIYTERKIGLNGNYKASYEIAGKEKTEDIATKISTELKTHSLYFSLQASKKIALITPFAGLRLFFNAAEYGYDWNYKAGTKEGSSSKNETIEMSFNSIKPQIFAGLGLNLALFQIGLDAAWNPATNYWTAACQLNFKL